MSKRFNTVEELRKLPKATLLAIARVSGGDGHSIFTPEAYRKAGMPEPLIAMFTRTIESDMRDPKSTLFKDGKAVKEITGIYGLTVVECVALALDLQPSDAMGRGFRAQQTMRHIEEALA